MKINLSFILAVLFMTAAFSSRAVPAKPGVMVFTQPDGTVVEAYMIGDEHFHFYETPSGELLLRDADGFIRRASLTSAGELSTSGVPTGVATPAAEATAIRRAIASRRAAIKEESVARRRVAPAPIPLAFPTTGVVKGLIIMAEFQDVKW
ncbi:MAG: hypothetical protein K2H88_03590, partial [Duncaniella sp.]|nr:hypothetical protein [Duncaniella sp.]